MKQLIMTPAQGKELIDGMKAELKEYALEMVVMFDDHATPLNIRDAAHVIRQSVLEFEERRLAAGRKEKTVDAPPKVDEKPVV